MAAGATWPLAACLRSVADAGGVHSMRGTPASRAPGHREPHPRFLLLNWRSPIGLVAGRRAPTFGTLCRDLIVMRRLRPIATHPGDIRQGRHSPMYLGPSESPAQRPYSSHLRGAYNVVAGRGKAHAPRKRTEKYPARA